MTKLYNRTAFNKDMNERFMKVEIEYKVIPTVLFMFDLNPFLTVTLYSLFFMNLFYFLLILIHHYIRSFQCFFQRFMKVEIEYKVIPTVLFMFDLNDLKKCNDNFGHEYGDC